MQTYKVLSALLGYPNEALIAAAPELRLTLDVEGLLGTQARAGIAKLLDELAARDLFEIEERYVDLFDRVRSLSLYLFEHLHGESRDRGQAMVELKGLYARHGCELAGSELPDYLPAFLEFLSQLDAREAASLLAETCALLEGITARLDARGSPYAGVFHALLDLGGHSATLPAVSGDDIRAEDDPAALDAAWLEAPAFDGAALGCGAPPKPDRSVIRIHPATPAAGAAAPRERAPA